MAVTDQQVLAELQEHLVEPVDNGATWPSGLWSVAEVTGYLNQRQYDFMKRTLLLITGPTALSTLAFVTRHAQPTDWIATQRVAWKDPSGTFTEVPRADGWEADHAILDWPNNASTQPPKGYTDGEVQTLTLETFPACSVAGQLQELYVALSATLSNSGVAFTVPDEFVPAIKW